MQPARTRARAKGPRRVAPPALAVALLASALVHAGIVAVKLVPARHAVRADAPVLEARLAAVAQVTPPALTVQPFAPHVERDALVSMAAARADALPLRPRTPAPASKPELEPDIAPPPAVEAAVESEPAVGAAQVDNESGDNLVAAQPLVAMARLGDELLARAVTEFPIEVQFPARAHGEIKARYPQVALAQGLQGDVIVWVVVSEGGDVQEIEFAEGDPIFRDAVLDAIRSSAFQPAADAGVGVRFPIALEFRFALADAGTAGAVEAAP
jgi:TonB family protein